MVKQINPAPRRPSPNVERDAEIYRLVVIERLGLESVGKRYDISRERARQVAVKQGGLKYALLIQVRDLRKIEAGQCLNCGITEKDHNGPGACEAFERFDIDGYLRKHTHISWLEAGRLYDGVRGYGR